MGLTIVNFDPDEYIDSISILSTEILRSELESMKEKLQDTKDRKETNQNMIDKYYDDPAFEHLIEMSIRDAPSDVDISGLEVKINIIENELVKREN